MILTESSCLLYMSEELATAYKSHDEEDLLFSLEYVLHAHQERVVIIKQNVLFEKSRLYLASLLHIALPHSLHREYLTCVLLLHQEHLPEPALSNHSFEYETGKRHIITLFQSRPFFYYFAAVFPTIKHLCFFQQFMVAYFLF